MTSPLISVIIPSYNSERFVGETLKSVEFSQQPEVEFIFIDGNSTDGTMNIVNKFRHLFSCIISEKDSGQSDAFNKGFRLARGEYLTWLNSDDVFCDGALSQVVEAIKNSRRPWYAANMLYIDEDSKILKSCQSGKFETWALRYGVLNVFGPSTIFSRELYREFGCFREDFHFCMDTEYWWRLASSGIVYERIPVHLWALRLHDDAKTAASITVGGDSRPLGMVAENERYASMYFPLVSGKARRWGMLLARFWRTLTGPYFRSIYFTVRFKGKSIWMLNKSST